MKCVFVILQEFEGIYGARPSGAGFCGAVIDLVDPSKKETIKAKIDAVYPVQFSAIKDVCEVNFCQTDDGARFVKMEDYK